MGLSSGICEAVCVCDPNLGRLNPVSRFDLSDSAGILRRVQWSPNHNEECSYVLGSKGLFILDDSSLLEQFRFKGDAHWADWNTNDIKMIAVSCSNSNVTLVDIASGSALQTITLHSVSGLKKHNVTRCSWSKQDSYCLVVGDNDGFIYVYDTRHSTRPILTAGGELGEVNCMSFTEDQSSIITSHGRKNHLVKWEFDKCSLRPWTSKFKNESDDNLTQTTTVSNASPRLGRGFRGLTRGSIRSFEAIAPNIFRGSQFYLSSRHLYCPAGQSRPHTSDLDIYDLKTGLRVKSIKSGDFSKSIFCVAGNLPESMVLYTGGATGLRVWSPDEDYQRRMEERNANYHQSNWDSDDD